MSKDYLTHHGILGQRWGKKNGPPYPLDAKNHSISEKKAGWEKSLNKQKFKDEKKELRTLNKTIAKDLTNIAYDTRSKENAEWWLDKNHKFLRETVEKRLDKINRRLEENTDSINKAMNRKIDLISKSEAQEKLNKIDKRFMFLYGFDLSAETIMKGSEEAVKNATKKKIKNQKQEELSRMMQLQQQEVIRQQTELIMQQQINLMIEQQIQQANLMNQIQQANLMNQMHTMY